MPGAALSLSAEVVPEAAAQAAGNLGSLISTSRNLPIPQAGQHEGPAPSPTYWACCWVRW